MIFYQLSIYTVVTNEQTNREAIFCCDFPCLSPERDWEDAVRLEGGHNISHHGPIKCWGVETSLFIDCNLRFYQYLFYIADERKEGGRLQNFTLLTNKVLERKTLLFIDRNLHLINICCC